MISSRFDPTLSLPISVYSGSANAASQGTRDYPSERSPLKIVFTENEPEGAEEKAKEDLPMA